MDATPEVRTGKRARARRLVRSDALLVRSPKVLESSVDGETVLTDAAAGVLYGFDAVGSRVWELCAEPHRLSELVAKLVDEYDIDPETCRAEVQRFLVEIVSDKLLQAADAGNS